MVTNKRFSKNAAMAPTVQGLGPCCISGRIDSGDPKGSIQEIQGIRCYLAEPAPLSKDFIVVIATDVFGYTLPNVRLVADSYAAQGFYCVVPDMFNGSEVPGDLMNRIHDLTGLNKEASFLDKLGAIASLLYNFSGFLFRNSGSKNLNTIKTIVQHLRQDSGCKKIAVQGYCWGGKIAAQMAQTDLIDAAIPSHAGGLSLPKDYESLLKPSFFQWAELDNQIPLSHCEKALPLIEKSGGKGKVYPKVHHGFAGLVLVITYLLYLVRGYLNDEQDQRMRLEAFDDAVNFLNTLFKK